MGRELLD